MAETENDGLLEMTTGILANYVSNNRIAPEELPGLISLIHASLAQLGTGVEPPSDEEFAIPSTAQVRKSVSEQGIRSFIDGRVYQSLKRHLAKNGMTPEQYRSKFRLSHDYPIVSPAYSARRSDLAKASGLGQKPAPAGKSARSTSAPKSKGAKART